MLSVTRVAAATVLLVGGLSGFIVPQTSLRHHTGATDLPKKFVDKNIDANAGSSRKSRPLNSIYDDKAAYEIEIGKALDTLKSDYPDLLTRPPDYSIYDPDLTVVDPAGVTLHGVANYKKAFKLVHSVFKLFYCREKSLLTFRLVYDCARNNIRVSWNVEVTPKVIFGGERQVLHVDGISVYELNRADGKVTEHRIEHLIINDTPVAPEHGLWFALQKECTDPDECSVPVFNTQHISKQNTMPNTLSKFTIGLHPRRSLFDAAPLFSTERNADESCGDMDWDAYETKNKSRKRFGLQPLTPEQFLEVEAEIRQMELEQIQKYESTITEDSAKEVPTKPKNGFLNKLFKDVFEDTCETNYDCQRPEVCCDFGFKKTCCSSGAMVGQQRYEPALMRVPVTNPPYPGNPQEGGGKYY